jgi:hypothetical protein
LEAALEVMATYPSDGSMTVTEDQNEGTEEQVAGQRAQADAEGRSSSTRHPREGMAKWKWPCTMAGFCLYLVLNGTSNAVPCKGFGLGEFTTD